MFFILYLITLWNPGIWHPSSEIPVLDEYGLKFGSFSWSFSKRFGSPVQVNGNDGLTPFKHKTYEGTVLGREALLYCDFTPGGRLIKLAIEWEMGEADDLQEFVSSIQTMLSEKYKNDKHYYESYPGTDLYDFHAILGNEIVTLGIDNGVTGIHYTIRTMGSTVILNGEDFY